MSQTPASLLVDRMTVHNRRLLWELQTINEISEGINQSLELDDVLTGALQRIVRAFDAVGASIRLRDERTGRYEMTASVGPSRVQRFWNGAASWPSEQVIATRTAVVVEDLAPGVSAVNRSEFMMRSGISLPLLAADELLGVLSIGASSPSPIRRRRRTTAGHHRRPDRCRRPERAAARLSAARQAGVGTDLRRDQRSDCRLRSSGPPAARQPGPRGAARTAGDRDSRRDLRRSRAVRRRLSHLRHRPCSRPRSAGARQRCPAVAGRHTRSRRTRRDHAGQRADPECDDVPGGRSRVRRRFGRAGREERDRRNSFGAAAAAHERRAEQDQRAAHGNSGALEVDAGAAAASREAVGDRSAGRRRGARAQQSADQRHRLCAAARERDALGRATAFER